ncbi:MAG: CheR family methyltransferase [Leeuwenhoekiella sp.]
MSTEEDSINEDLFVVGVGASAGGLDALTKFLSTFETNENNFCVVVVMHLSPDYKSELTSILEKRCRWPVVTAEENMHLERQKVYVTPQNCDIRFQDYRLLLDELTEPHTSAPSVDNFLNSLAENIGRKAIGIILSGYGHDGTEGITSISRNFGFTLAQTPESAEHKGMPKSALNSGEVDVAVPSEQMYDEIKHYIKNSRTIFDSKPNKKSIDAIFDLLEKRSGTDFSLYKPATIMRRINHRMASLNVNDIIAYYELIKNQPRELDLLFETVLIGVTEFFRDTEAFLSLENHLKAIIEDKNFGDSLRIWSVGCASGEEPYSIGILLYEIAGNRINDFHVQIFASDIDERALNFARKGVYKKESLQNMPENLVKKYFEKRSDDHYEIIKKIKQNTLFTRHDISNDPPFVKLDLVICRNLLIYFNNDLQKQTFQVFHYSLRPKGYLFLGKSESVSVASELFAKSNSNKIYKKSEASINYPLRFSRFKGQQAATAALNLKPATKKSRNMSLVDIAKETLYHKFEHPFVIINDQAEIKEVHGSLRLYIEISQGTMNTNLYKMANTELVTVIKATLAQVKKTRVPHLSHTIKFSLYDSDHFVKIRISPFLYSLGEVNHFFVIFQKIEPSEHVLDIEKKLKTQDYVDLRIKELEDELSSTKEHLQIFTEELEATNEELQTINEELQSANEELKSSNEELETSNEELQSANEELNTANNELRLSNEALIKKEEELKKEREIGKRNELIYRTIAENMPNGTVGILDSKFHIEYIAGDIFNEEGTDPTDLIGESWPNLNPSPEERRKLRQLCERTLNGEKGQLEVPYLESYYNIQTAPIRIGNGQTRILFLIQDLTESRKDRIKLNTALEAADLVVFEYKYEDSKFASDKDLCQLLECHEPDGIPEDKFISKMHAADVEDWQNCKKAARHGEKIKCELRFHLDSGLKYFRITGNVEVGGETSGQTIVGAMLDISHDKELLDQISRSEERFKTMAESAPVTIWITDQNNKTTYVNPHWCNYTGLSFEESLGDGWLDCIHPEDQRMSIKSLLEAADDYRPFEIEHMVRAKNGSYGWFLNRGIPMFDTSGTFQGYIGTDMDITAQKEFSEQLENMVAERTEELKNSNEKLVKLNINLEEYAYVASHDLQEPLRKIRMFNSIILNDKDDAGKVEQNSKKIESSAARMSDLIHNILEYSNINADQHEFGKIDIDKLIKNIKSDLEVLIAEKKVQITGSELGTITGNRLHLYQLFLNLIKNGIKFGGSPPQIEIASSIVNGEVVRKQFDNAGTDDYKLFKIRDNGIGMDKAQQRVIFKPFKKLHNQKEYPGTGIGLAICSKIVDLHKGFINVTSEPDQGSTFNVYIPINTI